ncbi:MAG: UPF0280 family protein [Pseudomonadota bacterium]
MNAPQAALLPDRRRLHLNHGPIDLIVEVFGTDPAEPYMRAARRFETVLCGLVGELDALRGRLGEVEFADPIARRMADAVRPFDRFVTPMAAVAGAVADAVLSAMVEGQDIPKAYVNNGGDIAFHLGPGQSFNSFGVAGEIRIQADDTVRGLATSGWRGRSHSLGIADAVTVLADSAAAADVAATLIANAVDLPRHPAIARARACDLSPDSDLGGRLVTTDVGPLTQAETCAALARGQAVAKRFRARGLIQQAILSLNDRHIHAAAEEALIHA